MLKIIRNCENSIILMYAEDNVLVSRGDEANEAIIRNQPLFNRYVDWTENNGFKINILKQKPVFYWISHLR